MIENLLVNVLGGKENDYSEAVCLAIAMYKEVHDKFSNNFGLYEKIQSIKRECILESQENRIDILIEYEDSKRLGIENKTWSTLSENQLFRYKDALRADKLVFLRPSSYNPDNKIPTTVCKVSYGQLVDILSDEKYKTDVLAQYLVMYFKNNEMEPLSINELNALPFYKSADDKLNNILKSIRIEGDGSIENQAGNYKLFPRMIDGILIYIGFRFGKNWYFNQVMLEDGISECVIYIKDEEPAEKQQAYNERVGKMEEQLKARCIDSKVEFYLKENSTQCRLSIRKSLNDFVNKNSRNVDISKWFKDNLMYLDETINQKA